MLNIAFLIALDKPGELELHVEAALRNGVTPEGNPGNPHAGGGVLRFSGGAERHAHRAGRRLERYAAKPRRQDTRRSARRGADMAFDSKPIGLAVVGSGRIGTLRARLAVGASGGALHRGLRSERSRRAQARGRPSARRCHSTDNDDVISHPEVERGDRLDERRRARRADAESDRAGKARARRKTARADARRRRPR